MSDKNCATTVAPTTGTPTDLSTLQVDARNHVKPQPPIAPPKVQGPSTVAPDSDLGAARLARPENIQCLMKPAPEHEPREPSPGHQREGQAVAGNTAAAQPVPVLSPIPPLNKTVSPPQPPAATNAARNTAATKTNTTTTPTPGTTAAKSTEYGIFKNPRWPYSGGTFNKIISFFANVIQFLKQILLALMGDTSHRPQLPKPLQPKPAIPPPAPQEALEKSKPQREALTVHRS